MNPLWWLLLLALPVLGVLFFVWTRRSRPSPPTPPRPTPPSPAPFLEVDILEPDGTGPARPDVVVRYSLRGTASTTVAIAAEYSDDGGSTFQPATELTGGASEGTSGLSASPAGDRHVFVWDSTTDTGSNTQQDLLLRITASDAGLSDVDVTPSFDTASGLAPSVSVVEVRSNRTDPHVILLYELADAQPSLSRVRVEYSDDGGQSWSPATEAPNLGSEGLVGLSASPAGDRHKFAWAAVQDLGRTQATGLLLKVEALDTRAGGADISSPFGIGVNVPPTASFLAPRGGTVRSPVMVRCLLRDPDSDPADIVLSYSVDGGLTFQTITPSTDAWSEPWSQLATSPDGEAHLFGWDAVADVGSRRPGVILRAEAADADQGPASDSRPFDVDVTGSPGRVQVLAPVSGSFGSPIPFRYRLVGQGPFSISVAYSTDQGLTFQPGTPDPSISDPLTGLAGGASGQDYIVFWDAAADLVGLGRVDDVLVRIEAVDAQGTAYEDVAGPIDITLNQRPGVRILSPGGNQVSSPVYIDYRLEDFENDFVDIDVQWSDDGGVTFRPATELTGAPAHEGTRNLASSYGGTPHVFVWDAPASARDVLVRVEPRDPKRGPAAVSQPFDIVAGTPARASLHAPGPGVVGAPVPLLYTVFDTGAPVDVEVEHSIGGAPYQPASEAADARSDGLTNLATSAAGTQHFFAWDFEADTNLATAADVRVRLTIRNAHGTTVVESERFAVDASRSGTPCSRNPTRQVAPPEVQVMLGTSQPHGPSRPSWTPTVNHHPVRFFVSHSRNERCNVAIEYRDAQGVFRPITPAEGSDDTTNLAAPYHSKAGYRVLWNVLADLGQGTHDTVVRVTPYIGSAVGPPDTTVPMRITVPGITPPAQAPASTAPTGVVMEKVDGDGQIGIAGLVMPTVLQVRVKEGGNQNLAGARVTFAVVRSTGPDVDEIELEPDFDLATTTDADGLAGVRVRSAPAQAAYTVEVSARVVGHPGAARTFTLDVRPGVLVPSSSNPGTVAYGEPYTLEYHLVADPTDTSRLDFLPDPDDPVIVDIAAVNGELSHAKVRVPGADTRTNRFSFQVIPNLLGSPASGVPSTDAVEVTLTSPTLALTRRERIPIETPYNSGHYAGPDGSAWNEVRLHLELVEGLEPPAPGTPQVGYGGITLTRKFRLELKDDAGNVYGQTIQPSDQFRCMLGTISLPTQELEVAWSANGGELTGAGQSGSFITVPISTEVEFSPAGAGPWRLTASVGAVVRDQSRVWTYTTSSGQTRCRRAQHGLSVHASRAVFVQRSPEIALLDAAAATPAVLARGEAGRRCLVEVSGLSDFRVGGQLEPIEIETTRLDGRPVRTISGYGHEFKQDLVLSPAGAGRLRSAPFTLVRGEPASSPSASHAILRNAWVRLQFYDVVFSVPTEARRLERERFKATPASLEPDLASALDSPTGTTPVAGVGGTVSLHNGEYTHTTCDLSFPTRVGALGVCRSYRSHGSRGAEDRSPLGPGWSLAWDEHLDVSRRWIRWRTADGRAVDFPGSGDPLERGCFFELRTSTVLDNDRSPYVLVGPYGDETHFHVDGSLRFTRDRHGNRFDFQYNARGRLERVYDCMTRGRYIAFEYFRGSGAVPDPREGRLTKITDYTGRRVVDLEYFAPPSNKAGLLREVSHPSVPTVLGGSVQSSRRPERYDYVFDADAGVWRVEEIRDAEDKLLVFNEYRGGRVSKQSHETSARPWEFAYDPAARTTTVTDGEGNATEYGFPASPYWDGTAPTSVITTGHPGTTFVHNRDGLLLEAAYPDGNEVRYRYQEFVPGSSPPRLSPARSRGNLLRSIEVDTGGEERVSAFSYDGRNRLRVSTGPRGTAPGADPLLNRVRYDWNRNADTLAKIVYPPVLSRSVLEIDPVAIATRTPPRPTSWFFYGWRGREFEYTPDGRVSKEIDPAGVVTLYLYYPDSDWNGAGGSAPTAAGGGLLGKVIKDAEVTAERDRQLPGVPLANQETRFVYDDLGRPREVTDPRGIVHEVKLGDANEVEEIVEASRTPAGTSSSPIRPARRKLTFGNDLRGLMSTVRQEEPTVPSEEGGPDTFSRVFDHLGRLQSTSAAVAASSRVESEVARDGNLRPETIRPPGHTQFPDSSTTLSHDARGLIDGVEVGGAAAPRPTSIGLTANGSMESMTFPGALAHTNHFDSFRAETGGVDPRGHASRLIKDRFGLSTRAVRYHAGSGGNPGRRLQPPNAEPGGFEERRYDEHGRLVRLHVGLFRPGATPAAGAAERIKRAPEYQEPLREPWPPVDATDIEDGDWGPCDGRVTYDYSYDTRGLLTRVVDDRGGIIMLRRDGLGRVIQATWDSGRHVVDYEYDENGNRTGMTLGIAYTAGGGLQNRRFPASMRYDARNRPYEFTDGRNRTIETNYSARGSVETATDARRHTTTMAPDGLGRVRRVEVPVANNPYIPSGRIMLTRDYHDAGLLKSLSDADVTPNTTEWEYDAEGRLEAIKYPGSRASGGQETRSRVFYDPVTGFVERTEDAESAVIRHHYVDGRLRRLEVAAPANPPGTRELRFEYDGDDRPVAGHDVTTGHRVRREHDSLGGVVAEEQGAYRVAYRRDGELRRTTLEHPGPGSFDVTYGVDREGRNTHVRIGNRVVARLSYRLPTRAWRRIQGPVRSEYEHDDAGLLEAVTVSGFASGDDLRFDLTRDDDGRLESCVLTQGSVRVAWEWAYDEPGRIERETRSTDRAGAAEEVTTDRSFDGDDVLRKERVRVGDGTTVLSDETVERTREERGRILSETNAPPLAYDRNGSLIRFGQTRFEYDAWHRLIRVLRGDQVLAEYEYDAFHRLVRRRTPEHTEDYIYDGWHLIEVRRDGEAVERYVYSSATDDVVFAEIGTDEYFVLSDPMGNTHAIVDGQGRIVQSYRYDLRGRVDVLDGGHQVVSQSPVVRLLFQHRAWDAVSGLFYFRARWYHPELGIFLTADPSGHAEGTEHYGLNHGDPVNFSDPFGLNDESEEKSVAWAVVTGFVEGLGIGGRALVNEGAKTVTLGFYEDDVLGVPDNPTDRRIYGYARVPARVTTEAAFAAGTAGLGTYAKGVQGVTRGERIIRGLNTAVHVGEGAQAIRDTRRGVEAFQEGRTLEGVILVAAGGLSGVGSASGLREMARTAEGRRLLVVAAAAGAGPEGLESGVALGSVLYLRGPWLDDVAEGSVDVMAGLSRTQRRDLRRLLEEYEYLMQAHAAGRGRELAGASPTLAGRLTEDDLAAAMVRLAENYGIAAGRHRRLYLPRDIRHSFPDEDMATFRVPDLLLELPADLGAGRAAARVNVDLTLERAATFGAFSSHKQAQMADSIINRVRMAIVSPSAARTRTIE